MVSDVMWLNLGSSYVNLHLVAENWCHLPVSAKDNNLYVFYKLDSCFRYRFSVISVDSVC